MHHNKKAPRKTQILVVLVALGLGLVLTQVHCAGGAGLESGDSSSDAGGSSPEAGADSNGSADTLQGVDASPNAGDATSDSPGDATSDSTSDAPDDATSDAPHDAGPAGEGGDGGIAWNAFLPLASGTSEGDGGTTPDITGHGYNATYSTGITFADAGLVLAGDDGLVSVPPRSSGSALNLTGSYSVSVWVTISDASGYQTFVSADGTQVSEFYLQLSANGYFAFALSYTDADQGATPSCVAGATSIAPQAGTLYHLVATRDAATGIDYLYVNGALFGVATCPATTGVGWLASTFGIGHGRFSGNPTDFVTGSISGVGFVDRVLTGTEVAELYSFGREYSP
jgi:Concanavalin A-like lectin/glucanases superfamily